MAGPTQRRSTTIVSARGQVVGLMVRELVVEVIAGPDQGLRCELDGRVLAIGADSQNHLVLTDDSVSRFHARIVADERGYRLTDRHSANGTILNGVRVQDAYLPDPARIQVGDSQLSVWFRDDEHPIELSAEERFGDVLGRSVVMRELFASARRAAASNATVLIAGETGTGKDALARAIHDHSPRASKPYVVFDCGAVSPTLVDAELFGHVRGAFTGAESDRPGVFEAAHGGTLFLDEIGELELSLQPKLLRALENGTVTRLGSTEPIPVDVRVVAATNRDLPREIDSERFRSDLFYRLAVVSLEVPPLRERPEDIPLLAAVFLESSIARESGDHERLRAHMDGVFEPLTHYPWPGNVRELRNVIERAAVLADPARLDQDIFSRMLELRSTIQLSRRRLGPLEEARAHFDREYLRDLLSAAGGDVTRAAEIADIHPKSLARLLRRYQIER